MIRPLYIQVPRIADMPGLAKRALQTIMRGSYQALGEHWKREMRPKHFTWAGASEYGYAPRQRAWLARKRKAGVFVPLVWTGESRRATAMAEVRPTFRGVRIVMRGTNFNWRHPASKADMQEEMRAVTDQEREALADAFMVPFDRLYQDELDRTVRRALSR